jgi:murein DD-endopeptidase MepM/ murein hydrolase activator NlpD
VIAAARRRRLMAPLAATAVAAGLATAVLDVLPGVERTAASGTAEPRLDRLTPTQGRPDYQDEVPARGRRATAVQIVGAGAPVEESADSEGPPPRVLRENARIRQQLDHLRALAAERRGVSRTLASAAASYDAPLRLGAGGLAWPITGPLTSPFGPRWGRLHAGIDIGAPEGTPIRAAESGRVVMAGWQGGYGNYTCIQHTASLSTCYAHQSRLGTKRGASVRQGQVMGYVGNTGNSFGAHLHFETWVRGRPVDPMPFL